MVKYSKFTDNVGSRNFTETPPLGSALVRSSHLRCSLNIGVLKKFATFTGKRRLKSAAIPDIRLAIGDFPEYYRKRYIEENI